MKSGCLGNIIPFVKKNLNSSIRVVPERWQLVLNVKLILST